MHCFGDEIAFEKGEGNLYNSIEKQTFSFNIFAFFMEKGGNNGTFCKEKIFILWQFLIDIT